MKFRKKPITIDAVRVNAVLLNAASNWDAMPFWLRQAYDGKNESGVRGITFEHDCVSITTLEGTMIASRGDWIVRGVVGEIYPCRSDIFDATYERV